MIISVTSALLIGFIIGTNTENYFSNQTYKLFKEYETRTEEDVKQIVKFAIYLRDKADYYEEAYKDTILENINLMKIMNRRK